MQCFSTKRASQQQLTLVSCITAIETKQNLWFWFSSYCQDRRETRHVTHVLYESCVAVLVQKYANASATLPLLCSWVQAMSPGFVRCQPVHWHLGWGSLGSFWQPGSCHPDLYWSLDQMQSLWMLVAAAAVAAAAVAAELVNLILRAGLCAVGLLRFGGLRGVGGCVH